MKRRRTGFAGLLALLAPLAAGASVDTSKPMLCAVTETIECGYEAECIAGSAEDVNLPPFIVIDPKARTLREHEGERTSTVQTVTENDGHLMLHGYEQRAYNITVSQQTGRLSAAAVSADAGFVMFGICTNQ